jgi:hypothetical protein
LGSRNVRNLMGELGINRYEIRAPLDMHIELRLCEIIFSQIVCVEELDKLIQRLKSGQAARIISSFHSASSLSWPYLWRSG